jgi:hypothetical protein
MSMAMVAVVAALGTTFDAQGARTDGAQEQIPAFNIPKMTAPPTIDGVINPEEWKTAMQIRGVGHAGSYPIIDRPHAFWLAWDENHLYIAARAHVLPGHVLLKSRREKYSSGVVHDDAFEFGVSMEDRNRLPGETPSFLKFIHSY